MTKAAIPAEAASAQEVSPVPPTASKHAPARSAGPTKFAMLKTAMYQRGRERTVSGTKAMTIASAVSAGDRRSAAAKIGASERCDPWCFWRSAPTRCTAAMIGTRMAKVSQSSRATTAGIAVRAKPAIVSQTTANSKAAAAGLSPERCGSCRAGRMTLL
jgi:hypothetical protein